MVLWTTSVDWIEWVVGFQLKELNDVGICLILWDSARAPKRRRSLAARRDGTHSRAAGDPSGALFIRNFVKGYVGRDDTIQQNDASLSLAQPKIKTPQETALFPRSLCSRGEARA